MLRDSREARYRFPRPTRRFTLISLGLLLLLGLAIGIFAYQVSPLRDGSFQPNSANAGSLIPWMGGVGENNWLQGAAVLAGLLATNLAIVLWQWSEPKGTKVSQFFRLMFWAWGGAVIFILSYLMFVLYLLAQWLVD
jgi:hypothetical protein